MNLAAIDPPAPLQEPTRRCRPDGGQPIQADGGDVVEQGSIAVEDRNHSLSRVPALRDHVGEVVTGEQEYPPVIRLVYRDCQGRLPLSGGATDG